MPKRETAQSCKALQSGMRKLLAQAGQKWASCVWVLTGVRAAPSTLGSAFDFDAPVLGLSKCAPRATHATCLARLAGPVGPCCRAPLFSQLATTPTLIAQPCARNVWDWQRCRVRCRISLHEAIPSAVVRHHDLCVCIRFPLYSCGGGDVQ